MDSAADVSNGLNGEERSGESGGASPFTDELAEAYFLGEPASPNKTGPPLRVSPFRSIGGV